MSMSLNHSLIEVGLIAVKPDQAMIEVVELNLTEAIRTPSDIPPIALPRPSEN